jgi:hypothetical protein
MDIFHLALCRENIYGASGIENVKTEGRTQESQYAFICSTLGKEVMIIPSA